MELSQEEKEILRDFVTEALEGLEKAEGRLLQWEEQIAANQTVQTEQIDALFRIFHSIKGSAGFIGLQAINGLTHQAESLLDLLRKNKIRLEQSHIDLLLQVCDGLRLLLAHVREHNSEQGFDVDFSELNQKLQPFAQGTEAPPSSDEKKRSSTEPVESSGPSFKFSNEMLITDEMKKEFAEESSELLDKLEQDLMALEKTPRDANLLNSVFRGMHSIKGNAGFLGFKDISEVTHQAETVFDLAREGKFTLTSKQISLVLQILDFIRSALQALKQNKPPVIPGKHALIDLMGEMVEQVTVQADNSAKNAKAPETVKTAKKKKTGEMPQRPPELTRQNLSDVIRVDVDKVNHLMNLVGEIVIAQSMVVNHPALELDEVDSLNKALDYLQKNVRELQELATSMRMIPLSGLFGKMRRLVRDISARHGKKVELVIRGGETEVDRSIIEHVSDPLVHILRNAIDHGIEDAEARIRAGKPEYGSILLEAQRVGGEIWISVRDDGQGLNKEKILKRAKEKGFWNSDIDPQNDEEVYRLIFKPGFSTADKVTNLSGRGVGMDVVQKNIEKIRGRIELKSKEGSGTTFTMKIPLTTAIVDGMLLRVGNGLFAVPMADIKESISVDDQNFVELIDGQEVMKVRDEIIPIIRLERVFSNKDRSSRSLSPQIVVISEIAGQKVGFLVDALLGQQQLVIKPLPEYLGNPEGLSGCAILGDGEICMILDMGAMAQMGQAISMA